MLLRNGKINIDLTRRGFGIIFWEVSCLGENIRPAGVVSVSHQHGRAFMTRLTEGLSADLKADLAAIRSAVRRLYAPPVPANPAGGTDPLDAGERILALLDRWLLDAEQQQMLRQNPGDIFFLQAAAALCPIGGNSPGPGNPILARWRDLGIRDAATAEIITAICCSAGVGESAMDGKGGSTGDARVNAPLVSAAIRLARALDLQDDETAREVIGFMSEEIAMTSEGVRESFTVADAGPHPYFPGTIRLVIRCRHAEVHRALKRHERSVQRRLNEANRVCQPPVSLFRRGV